MATTTNLHALTLRLRKQLFTGLSSAISESVPFRTLVKHKKVAFGCALVAGTAYLASEWYERTADKQIVQSLLNSGFDGLATDEIDEGPIFLGPGDDFTEEEASSDAVDATGPSNQDASTPQTHATPNPRSSKFVEINGTPTLVDLHRGVKQGRQMQYMNAVIAECKVKFGVPSNTTANRKAVERFAGGIMKKHGVRPTHIQMYLPLVTKMVFVPNKWQVEAERIAGTRSAWKAVMEYLWYNARSVVPRDDHN